MHLYAKHDVLLVNEPAISTRGHYSVRADSARVSRSPKFLLNPIIARALLGPRSLDVYPALSTAGEFVLRGYTFDPHPIASEIRRLLFCGSVHISKNDVCRGNGDTLAFSPSLHARIRNALSKCAWSSILNYIAARSAKESGLGTAVTSVATTESPVSSDQASTTGSSSSTLGSATSAQSLITRRLDQEIIRLAGCIEEKDRLIAELKKQRNEVDQCAGRSIARAQAFEQVNKTQRDDLGVANKQVKALRKQLNSIRKKYYNVQYRLRSKPDLGLNGRRPVEVRNLCGDPSSVRESWQKRKRDPTLAFECAWVMIRGTKEPRPFGGGVRWTLETRVEEFKNFERSGMEAARRAVHLREAALHGRCLRLFVVPIGRKGCLRRNVLFTSKQKKVRAANAMMKASLLREDDDEMTLMEALDDPRPLEGVRLFDHPSRRTTYRDIIPACQLLFSRWAGEMLYAENTERIGLNADFAKSKGFACCGAVVSAIQSEMVLQDPRGAKLFMLRTRSFNLPMTQSTNKLTRELKDSEGNTFMTEAPKCLAKSMFVGNAAVHLLRHPEMWVFAVDGAAENSGRGLGTRARENLNTPGGIFYELVTTGRVWPAVIAEAQKAGLREPLDDFFQNSSFQWPGGESAKLAEMSAEKSALDTSGPVHKDPKAVEAVHTRYVSATIEVKNEARTTTLAELRIAAAAAQQPNRPMKFIGPIRDPQERQRQQQAEVKRGNHESEFQRRLCNARQKSLRLYEQRTALLQRQQASPSTAPVPLVSMEHNPARFLPCMCTTDGRSLGEARHCGMHRAHNLTDKFVAKLNKGFLEQVVSASTYFSSEYRWPDIRPTINFLLVPTQLAEISMKSEFYRSVLELVKEVMELSFLMEQCEFEISKGAQPPVTAGMARWGTALGAAAYLDKWRRLLAFALLKRYAHGLEENKVRACADVLTTGEFKSGDYQNIQIEHHAERHFALITAPSDCLQLAIASWVNSVVVRPLLAGISSNDECGLEAMGVNGIIRRILLVLARDIWLRSFAHRGWGLGWNRRTVLAISSHGAEFNPESSLRLLNPHCADRVKQRFGNFPGMQNLVEEAANATAKLLRTIEEVARMDGQMLPDDSLAHWKRTNPDLAKMTTTRPDSGACEKHKQLFEGRESFAARVSQAHWLVGAIARDSIDALTRKDGGFHRELFGFSGFIANAGKSTSSADMYTFVQPNGETTQSHAVIIDVFSVPNAMNAFVQARDIVAHYESRGVSKAELAKRLPSYCRWWIDPQQIQKFIVQGREKSPLVRNGKGRSTDLGVLPLSCFPNVDKCSREASACLCNSKKVESSFSPMKVVCRSKGQSLFDLISMLYRRRNFPTAGLDAEMIKNTPDLYWKAETLAKLAGWDWVNKRDDVLGDLYRDADLADNLNQKNKRVSQGSNFNDPRHGGADRSRTDKYRVHKRARDEGGGNGSKAGRGARISTEIDQGGVGGGKAGRGGDKAVRGGEPPRGVAARQIRLGGETGRGVALIRGCKRAKHDSPGLQGDAAAGLGSDGGAESGAVGRGGEDRDVGIDATVDAAECIMMPRPTTTVSVPLFPPPQLGGGRIAGGDRIAPQINQHAKLILSRRRAAIEKKRRTRISAELKKLVAERQELAMADSDPEPSGSEDDADYFPGRNKSSGAQRRPRTGPTRQEIQYQQTAAAEQAAEAAGTAAAVRKRRGGCGRGKFVGRQSSRRGVCGKAAAPTKLAKHGQSSTSELSSAEDEDSSDDIPLANLLPVSSRLAGISEPAASAPLVGAKVEIKWQQKQCTGWFKGTVTAISGGKLPAPARGSKGRRRVVAAGYSVVQYDVDKTHYVHLLDKAHHVSNWGDRGDAWRLACGPDDANNVGLEAGRNAELHAAAYSNDDASTSLGRSTSSPACVGLTAPAAVDDDDLPLFPFLANARNSDCNSPAGGDRAGAAAQIAIAPDLFDAESRRSTGGSRGAKRAAEMLKPGGTVAVARPKPRRDVNVWSLDYCFDVFEMIQPEEFRLSIAKYSVGGSYIVTRQMPTKGGFPKEADIRIEVKTEKSRVCYIAYTMETGTTLFMVNQIRRPNGTDWSNTLRGYQMFTTEQALIRVDTESDTIFKGYATSMGATSLRAELTVDTNRCRTTYHPTDWEVSMDVRCIVGVVRQAQDTHRESYNRAQMHGQWPAKSSLIFSGVAYSESH